MYYSDSEGYIPWPVLQFFNNLKRRLGSPWGPRDCKGCSKFHKGVDINFGSRDDDFGAPILATHSGEVIEVNTDIKSSAGRYVKIKSFNGKVHTRYLHLSSTTVKKGDEIDEGATIGYIGGSGLGSERGYNVHLHYELYLNDKRTNPQDSQGNLIDPQLYAYPAFPKFDILDQTPLSYEGFLVDVLEWRTDVEETDANNDERIRKSKAENRPDTIVVGSVSTSGIVFPSTPLPSRDSINPIIPGGGSNTPAPINCTDCDRPRG